MNINEFIQSIPEELHGNICHSSDRITFTPPKGKPVTFLFGAENSYKDTQGNIVKVRELVDYDEKLLEGVELKPVEPMEQVETVEASQDDVPATLTRLDERVKALELKTPAEPIKAGLMARIKAVFTGV